MSENTSEYLPDDPRFGKSDDELKSYYSSKPAEWAIYCWDEPESLERRGTHLQEQRLYVSNFDEKVIGYGHLVSDNALDTLGTTFFLQLDNRDEVEKFLESEPLRKSGVYASIDIHRWSNSFIKRQKDYERKGQKQFLLTGSKIDNTESLFDAHLTSHEKYFRSFENDFIIRGPICSDDGTTNIGTALLIELPDRLAAERFWANEPFVANNGYKEDSRIYRWVFGD
ncbi:MAG: hypothetical protein CL568_05380 [Alphaproteobacteria bacterium]|jgi:uncharacterized protein YciI|nr:hypothetical protein [Alphaproteobacteria bacterium]PPR13593.1 MAG: hypothetical protein CFH42_01346 [Alphaproteobacteria bacterium MarineAlpha12_Bin1]|tara:strand:- start:3500 stop:4177 length:678 start_codon:yes stop_codon:yes gene_type:complete